MDDSFRFMGMQAGPQFFFVKNISPDAFSPFRQLAGIPWKDIVDNHLMTRCGQSLAGMAADVSCAACYEYLHKVALIGSIRVSKNMQGVGNGLVISQ